MKGFFEEPWNANRNGMLRVEVRMLRIEEQSVFALPIETVFDGERDISIHSATQNHRSERAVGGVVSGLIEAGQEVEWEAVHFGIRQRLRVRITHMRRPSVQ